MDHKKFGAFSKFGSLKLLFKWLKDWAGPAGGLLALLFPPPPPFVFQSKGEGKIQPDNPTQFKHSPKSGAWLLYLGSVWVNCLKKYVFLKSAILKSVFRKHN